MPELPEVETTRRALERVVPGRRIECLSVRNRALRWPVPRGLEARLFGAALGPPRRRGKYLLLPAGDGTLIVHFGMSGSLRVATPADPWRKHDHAEIVLDDGRSLRLHDPRRFGALLWTPDDPERHPLLRHLGPEPLDDAFDADCLHAATRGRRRAIKLLIMDARVVVGVGNIYASEALFRAGIRPGRAAGRLTREECARLVRAIRAVLREALRRGGTTLRDYLYGQSETGGFQLRLRVYGRAGEACPRCGGTVRGRRQGQRSTFYCPGCQK